jgi:hypothetical protein
VPETGFVKDTRLPIVIDPHLYVFRFAKAGTEDTIATLVNWGNHPETLGGNNPLLTSDFPNWLRLGMEDGLPEPNGMPGFGGMCLYFQGMVGGLMTQLHVDVPSRDGSTSYKDDSWEKAQALGENAALLAGRALRSDKAWKNENPELAVAAKTVMAPVQGIFRWGIMLGLIHRGYYFGGKARTEIDVLRIGDAMILTVPGELYPEIVQGGVVALPGRYYPVLPQEVPPLREAMEKHAKMAFVIGLANDEIGYIVPKSEWDTKAPFVYNNKDQYGEENSGGPEVAPMIHHESLALIDEVNQSFEKAAPAQQQASAK